MFHNIKDNYKWTKSGTTLFNTFFKKCSLCDLKTFQDSYRKNNQLHGGNSDSALSYKVTPPPPLTLDIAYYVNNSSTPLTC